MAGFLASDIAERNRQAVRVVQAETAELRNVFTLSVASKPDMRDIRAAWTDGVRLERAAGVDAGSGEPAVDPGPAR